MNSDEVAFLPTDFERFRESVQTDPEFNEARLEVRRKLERIGKVAADALSTAPYLLVARASIHHPHRFNGFRVAQQCTYLSRGEKERTFLKKHLGDEIGEDLDTDYIHTQLVLQIDERGLIFALRIHPKAWWDGENLKRLLGDEDERPTIASALQPLEGYSLRVHDHKRTRECKGIDDLELAEMRKSFTPGEHWLHVERRFERDDLFITSGGFEQRAIAEWKRLLPAYRCFCWHPDNDRLFA
ncbi:MAG: hypothetical protein VX949_10345 [Planctomycetota bacterium]|nr:hypothetical protein [Planctomycetota bacterium]